MRNVHIKNNMVVAELNAKEIEFFNKLIAKAKSKNP